MAKGCFLLFILGWETFVWRSYAEQKSNDLFHEAIALRRVAELIQGSNLVIHESLSFFGKKWICHDLSIWIRTYLEATTKQWYLYDHGNRGYHYRKIYWDLGLQEKTVIKGCIGQWTYQSLVSTCSFDAEIKKSDHHIISPNDMFQDFVITIGFCQTKHILRHINKPDRHIISPNLMIPFSIFSYLPSIFYVTFAQNSDDSYPNSPPATKLPWQKSVDFLASRVWLPDSI